MQLETPMTPSGPLTIDAQVHAYERDHAGRPWQAVLEGPCEVTGDDMIAAMDAAAVDAALLVSSITLYGFDPGYALDAYAQHPERFALIKPFDPASPDVAEEIAGWAATPGVVGTRVLLDYQPTWTVEDSGLNRIFSASADCGLPLAVHAPGHLPLIAQLADRHPNTQVVLDHLGLEQPLTPPPPEAPFADLPNILALAERDNVVIKISGACTLSHEPFPYNDIWPFLMTIIERYGLERCLWGTDWTRAVNLLTYEESVRAFTQTDRLDDAERCALMGGNLMRIYDWRPSRGRYGQHLEATHG